MFWPHMTDSPRISQDAAIVLALADTAVPFAVSLEDEAERWVRVMRMHGQVGAALQALGVGEAPLETPAAGPGESHGTEALGRSAVNAVGEAAGALARERGARVVTTVDILFAVMELYGRTFDRALYVRGASRDELIERLAGGVEASRLAASAWLRRESSGQGVLRRWRATTFAASLTIFSRASVDLCGGSSGSSRAPARRVTATIT